MNLRLTFQTYKHRTSHSDLSGSYFPQSCNTLINKIMRRKGIIVLMMVSLCLCACANGDKDENPPDRSERVEQILSEMTLEEKVEQMMFVSFREWKSSHTPDDIKTVQNKESDELKDNITELNDIFRNVLQTYHFGGFVLFSENYYCAEQTLKLTADIQKTTVEAGGIPLLIATDQEGGNVSRVIFGTWGVGNMALAATGNSDNAKEMASIYGNELRLLGINTDFGPVLDVNSNPANPVIGARSFSDDPKVVSEYGMKYVEGLHEAGVPATIKHFPGHGDTDTDSHTGFPVVNKTYDELKSMELIPFQEAINTGADMVMTAHIQFPRIEPAPYISVSTGENVCLPATLSRVFMTDILRNDMGFEGVTVSDALDMSAITDHFKTEDVIRYSINAGVDMLTLPSVRDNADLDLCKEIIDTAIELAKNGEIRMERIDESVRRILRIKEKYGLLDQKDFSVTNEMIRAAREGVGNRESMDIAWNIAEQAVTVVKNENHALPISAKEGESILILFSDSSASRASSWDVANSILKDKDILPRNIEINVIPNTADNSKECMEAAKKADHVILVYRTYNEACLDPDTEEGSSSGVFDHIIDTRHQESKNVILVSCSLPYDATRFSEADAILLTYMSSNIRQISPENGREINFVPNLPAALCICFGCGEANGKVPVYLPEINENKKLIKENPVEGKWY